MRGAEVGERGLPLLLDAGGGGGLALGDGGLTAVEGFEGFFGEGIERL